MHTSTEREFIIHAVIPAAEIMLDKGFYIVITNALTTPPHLGLLLNSQLYSLSVKGVTVNSNLQSFFRMLKTKNIKTIFVHLKQPATTTNLALQAIVTTAFQKYSQLDVIAGITCLSPIKESCRLLFNIPVNGIQVIFDLLPQLHQQQAITAYSALNLNEEISNGKVILTKYTLAEVNSGIKIASGSLL